ncbi:MAG TPA: metallophosphoesterase family protein [Actinomycetota bacterium]|nr:metallophosphoesterase family protein [Actinomycetota bacterium]
MLIGFVSDPHANLPALEAVLKDVRTVSPDMVVCLGDLVGYGPFPNETVAAVTAEATQILAGNHDLAVTGEIDPETFNSYAKAAIDWTASALTPDNTALLRGFEPTAIFRDHMLAHGSPRRPADEYIVSVNEAHENFKDSHFETAFVGHTHQPAAFLLRDDDVVSLRPVPGEELAVGSSRAILNPGSVGQPRDGDPRASWGVWDEESRNFTVRKVEYPIEQTQAAILQAGLPELLAWRLGEGR